MITQAIFPTAVRELMTKEVVTVAPSDTMDKIKNIFENLSIHHVVVTDETKKVVGIISTKDYNRVLNSFMLFNKERNEKINLTTLKALEVKDVMSKQFAFIHEGDALAKAADMFKENLFHALPVVGEDKTLKGIITTFDLLVFAYAEPPMLVGKDK